MRAASRIRWLTFGSVLITAFAISVTAILGAASVVRDAERQRLQQDVLRESERLRIALQEARNDVRLLAALPIARQVLEAAQSGRDQAGRGEQRGLLADAFREMLHAKPSYAQVRLIGADPGGRELVRVNRTPDGVVEAPRRALQSKQAEPYYRRTLETPSGQVYASPVTLNRENGRIQTPHQPVARYAMRIDGDDGRPAGMVVINVDFDRFVAGLFTSIPESQGLYLTNAAGDFILHPDPAASFGFQLGQRRRVQDLSPRAEALFNDDAPEELSLAVELPAGRRWLQLRRVEVGGGPNARFLVLAIADKPWGVGAASAVVIQRVVGVTLLLCAVSGLAALAVGRLQTRPLYQVTRAAQCVARGEPMPLLPVRLGNELGDLARAVRDMNQAVRSRQRELQLANRQLASANDDLEHFVHIASHDLREPLRKQRKLIDLLDEGAGSVELLSHIKDCSQSMQTMIDDFRSLSRVGRDQMTRTPACLSDLIRAVLVEHQSEIAFRRCQVDMDDFPAESSVYEGLVQVLYDNLVRNALRHAHGDSFNLHFTAERLNGQWWYGVRNTGSSIPPEKLNEVFKLFRKGGRDGGGAGVGLSICRKVVERHRGQIHALSDQNGVHIQFTLEDGYELPPTGQ